MKTAIRMAAALAVLLMATAAQAADPVSLRFASLSPANSFLVTDFMKPWTDRIVAASNGTLKIDRFDGMTLADNLNVHERVLSDVIQMAWGLQIYGGGKYIHSDVVSLPFIANTGEAGSVAFWRMYQRGLLKEYDEVKPLVLMAFPQQGLHTTQKDVKKLEDLQGMKLRAAAKVVVQMISLLGATPVSLNVGEMYEALQRGTAEGTLMPWTAFPPFRMQEVTKYHIDVPLGSSPAMIFMSKKKFDSLPPEAKKAIDDNSGEKASREFARIFDRVQNGIRASIKNAPGHVVSELPPEEFARWKAKVEPVTAEWIKSTPGGEMIAAEYTKEVRAAEAEVGK